MHSSRIHKRTDATPAVLTRHFDSNLTAQACTLLTAQACTLLTAQACTLLTAQVCTSEQLLLTSQKRNRARLLGRMSMHPYLASPMLTYGHTCMITCTQMAHGPRNDDATTQAAVVPSAIVAPVCAHAYVCIPKCHLPDLL